MRDIVQVAAFSAKIITARVWSTTLQNRVEVHACVCPSLRRDGRVAEGARLESVFRGNSNVGSNPTLSAILLTRVNTALSASYVDACAKIVLASFAWGSERRVCT